MKKVSMALLFALTTIGFYSCGTSNAETQNTTKTSEVKIDEKKDELVVAHQRDEIEGSDYYSMSEPLFVKEGKDGFSIVLSLKQKQGKIVYNDIMVNASKVGACHENTIIYVLFEDGTKTQLKQWNDFNCDGNVYLDLNHKELKKLNKPMKAIKLVNGRDYESFEKTFTEDFDKNYFVNVIKALETQKIIEVKELPTY